MHFIYLVDAARNQFIYMYTNILPLLVACLNCSVFGVHTTVLCFCLAPFWGGLM